MSAATIPTLDGRWGAAGARLEVKDGRGVLELDCGRVTFDRLRVDAWSRLAGSGRYEAYQPGPQAAEAAPATKAAEIVSGSLTDGLLSMDVRIKGEREPRRYALSKGFYPKIIRCL